jgi:hypothetical protein
MHFGAGIAADSTYFPAMYPDRGTTGVGYGPNALWVAILTSARAA